MPNWIPKKRTLEEDIAEEQARIEAWRTQKTLTLPEEEPLPILPIPQRRVLPDLMATSQIPQFLTPIQPTIETYPIEPSPYASLINQPQEEQPTPYYGQPTPQPMHTRPISEMGIQPTIELPIVPKQEAPKEPGVTVPFWRRALQVFAAPFEWVDETIIKPSLSLLATTGGFIPEVERKTGEDYWEWKKRSWAGWKAPGININVPWSDEPWRVDIRGVMELAPWLLIPGAGQVGGGIKAGVGVAGMIGKVGRAGRLIGYAVEYSPWGLVEKTAGVAIKGGVRAVGKVSERMSTAISEKLYGKYVPPPVPESVAKFTNYMKEVVIPARKEFRKLVPEEVTARQEAKVQKVFASYRKGEFPLSELQSRLNMARGGGIKGEFALTPEALAARQAKAIANVEARVVSGELTEAGGKALITKIRKNPAFTAVSLTDVEVKELNDMIINSVESGLVKADSADAFLELALQGKLPQPHNIRDWAKVYGDDFAKAVGKLKVQGIAGSQLVDTLNIGRSLLSSADLSGTFRQGLFYSLLHPTKVPIWFYRQMKAVLSEKWTLEMDDILKTNPIYKKWVSRGVYFAPQRGATIVTAEEYFPSMVARRIPFVRRSERAFNTFLNEARLSTCEIAEKAMIAQGATEAELKLFAEFINIAGGRGILPKSLEKYAPALNTVFFSPRLQAATLQMPRQIGRMLISNNPYMRKEAAKTLVTFVGGGAALLGLLNASGRSKIEIDPRSVDFGKIKIGETRLDIWRGYVQYARFAAQLLSGERKSAFGNMNSAKRAETALRFLQSKSSPAFGIMVDLLRGENYAGKPIFSDTTGFSKVARERVLPLAVQDIIDAMEQSGINGLWVAAPATLGVGALTYVNDFVRLKEKIAREMGYESWDDIDPKTQKEIQNRNAELQTATIAFDRQVMGTASGDWRLAGNAIEEIFRQNVDNAVGKYQASVEANRGITFREDISNAWTARRGGYDAREKEARFEDIVKRLKVQDTAEALVGLGPEQLAIKIYNDALYGDDMQDEFGDYRFDEAEIRKQQLRQQLGNELFNYVEQYQAVRYEDFPPEFRELIRAKIAMRSYWQVEDRVVALFGQQFADSPRGQAFITKQRRMLRLSNPDINKYYQMFYAQV